MLFRSVISPFIGSPAEKVGIKIKDKIIKVDGKDILPLTANETVKLLKGKEGTKVDVEVVREGKKEPMKFTLTRAKIKLEMVESKMLENNIGYVSLLRFGKDLCPPVGLASKGENVRRSCIRCRFVGRGCWPIAACRISRLPPCWCTTLVEYYPLILQR